MVAHPRRPLPHGKPGERGGPRRRRGAAGRGGARRFWMGKHEVTWNEYDLFAVSRRGDAPPPPPPAGSDAVTRPTPPYADESFGYGKGRQPALSINWHAAMEYCRWLSEKTGRSYRLPTEAEWEYACRAGPRRASPPVTTRPALRDHAWSAGQCRRPPSSGAAASGRTPGASSTCPATWPNGCVDRYDAATYAGWAVAGAPVSQPGRSARRASGTLTSCGAAPGTTIRRGCAAPRAAPRRRPGTAATRNGPRASGG